MAALLNWYDFTGGPDGVSNIPKPTFFGLEIGRGAGSFGDVFGLTLTHSRIPAGVSHKQFLGPRPRPGDDRHGILPDVPMSRELLRPYREEQDPVLAFAVERIRERRD